MPVLTLTILMAMLELTAKTSPASETATGAQTIGAGAAVTQAETSRITKRWRGR